MKLKKLINLWSLCASSFYYECTPFLEREIEKITILDNVMLVYLK